jgi:uncharacterized membrane protein YuzA (DUF378 family)
MSGSVDKIAIVLVLVGALNWGLIGALNVNLVDTVSSALSGSDASMRQNVNRAVYVLVGVAALWVAYQKLSKRHSSQSSSSGSV